MALSIKREGLKHVPWFSISEWHGVYKQIYSNDTAEQIKGYKYLLVWKARVPKLPVGVDCTLSIIQVCLRDRELTPKIDDAELPVYYENDLCLMYSTTIMRVLNHISHIGRMQQTSLFQIAKQLKIPDWIVNLRHDAAHGHELPSINLLRLAANILLTWLHEEYWAAEAKSMEDYLVKEDEIIEIEEPEEARALTDLIELWIAVGLYSQAKYILIKDVPDVELRKTLQSLRTYALSVSWNNSVDKNVKSDLQHDKKYTLATARAILLSEISRHLEENESTSSKEELVLNVLFESEAFLPSQNFVVIFQRENTRNDLKEDRLPLNIIQFWQDFILLLQERRMLQNLVLKLLKLIGEGQESKYKKFIASLWIDSIIRGLIKMNTARQVTRTLEQVVRNKRRKVSIKLQPSKVQNTVNHNCPQLKHTLSLNVSDDVPSCLTDLNFVTELILNVNEFSIKFIPALLELVSPNIPKSTTENLMKLIKIYMGNEIIRDISDNTAIDNKIYTAEDLESLCDKQNEKNLQIQTEESASNIKMIPEVGDRTIRNSNWKLAPTNCDWSVCPMGILPWQLNSMETLGPLTVTPSKCIVGPTESDVIPGIIDSKNLNIQSKIDWEAVFKKKRRTKRKWQKGDADTMVNRAIEIIRKQQ